MNDDTSTAPESIETPPEETAEEAAAREAAEAAAAIAATKPPEHCPLCPRYTTGHRCRASVPRSGAASDILWVYAQPELLDAGAANPGSAGPTASVMKVALNALWQQHPEWQRLSIRRTYAVQCTPLKEGEKPRKATLDACAPHLADVIVETAPKLVVAFGSEVLKQLGVEAKFSDVRGRVLEPAVTGFPVPILVTFSDRQIAAAPGVFETFKQDLRNGYMRIVRGTSTDTAFEELTKEYVSPATMDEALALLDEILATPETTTLSVDTETTSLRPEKDGTKIIAFCFSWGVGKAATLLFDHPHAPPEYLERLGELEAQIRRLLASPRPKVLHNAKFDLKWIELKYRMPVANVVWCTLCGEHLLDEDKKGNYGLKALTAVWIPKFCGYEDKLYDILEDAEKNPYAEVDAKLETLTEEYDGYAEELIAYKAAMTDYETKQQEWQRIKDEYDAARAEYEQKNEAYKAALAAWEARPKRGLKPSKPKAPKKDEATPEALAAHLEHLRTYDAALAAWEAWETPPKPVKDFLAPPRPLALERPPKMPKDPRTKKEIHYATDAGFEKVPLHELQLYGGVDADVTRRLSSIQLNRLNEEAKQSGLVSSHTRRLMATHAVPASRVLGEMEYYGTRIDQAYIGVLQKGLTKVIEDSLAELAKMAPGVNINSAPELAKLLYDQGWTHPDGTAMPTVKCLELTKGGARSVAEKGLKPYLKYDTVTENGKKKEIPKKESYFLHHLFLYKKAMKARDTFLVNIRVLSRRDGVIHTSFHLNGTGTGRLSCFTADMRVRTQRGDVPISAVRVGDHVWTHRQRWQPVLAVLDQGDREVEDFHLSVGAVLSATDDHRMYTTEGEWVSIGTLADEYFQELDGSAGESRARRIAVHGHGAPFDRGGDRTTPEDHARHRESDLARRSRGTRAQGLGGVAVLEIEDWQQEPHEREDAEPASQLEGTLREQRWVSDGPAQWDTADGTPRSDGASAGAPTPAREMGRTPYRRGQAEQHARQPGAGYRSRAQGDSQSRDALVGAAVTARHHRRYARVFDLTVEGDHSFVVEGVFAHNSSDMNLQNVPKKLAGYNLKKLFIADSSDYVIVNADYKGAEVRVFTAYARDPALIKALNEGLDMHSFFAAKVFGHPYEDFENRDNEASGLSKEYRDLLGKLRTQIKRVVFGILYGAGEGKIAETIGVTKEDGKALIELLFTMFPAIKDYIEEVKMLVMRDGYVETLFGRRRRFPLTATSRHRSRAERQACNFKIQSTSSDIVIGQLIEIRNVIFSEQTWPEWGIHKPLHTYGVRLLLTVHDSIVLQWPKKLLPALEPWLTHYGETRVRDKYPWLPVPFKMDIEVGDSYGECMPIPKYIQGLPPDFFEEGVIEEQELLTELREDAFEGT